MHFLYQLLLCGASFSHTGWFFHHTFFHHISIEPRWAVSSPWTKADSITFVVLFFIEGPQVGASHNNRAAKLSFYVHPLSSVSLSIFSNSSWVTFQNCQWPFLHSDKRTSLFLESLEIHTSWVSLFCSLQDHRPTLIGMTISKCSSFISLKGRSRTIDLGGWISIGFGYG